MRVVVKLDRVFIVEYRPRLFEADTMFVEVCPGLLRVPRETQLLHNYIVATRYQFVNRSIDCLRSARKQITRPRGSCKRESRGFSVIAFDESAEFLPTSNDTFSLRHEWPCRKKKEASQGDRFDRIGLTGPGLRQQRAQGFDKGI